MLTLSQVKKTFSNKEVLKGVNISFEEGKIHGVIGKNGAGKTTLFNIICGLEKYRGEIHHINYDTPLKNHIAYLPTSSYFHPMITGKEYLSYFLEISGHIQERNFIEWSELFKLPLDKYVDNYSTGMKKKLAFLAIILLQRPIYILDEPFNGLDMEAVLLFKNIILKLRKSNSIVIISSHIISTLIEISDDICYIDNGIIDEIFYPSDFSRIENKLSDGIMGDITDLLKL